MKMNNEKCIVIGWDAPIIKRIQKYISESQMPNIKRLIEDGVWAENCLVPPPPHQTGQLSLLVHGQEHIRLYVSTY